MTLLEAQGWGYLIASLGAAILTIHNGWKIQKVHELSNSRLKRIEDELTATKILLDMSRDAEWAAEKARLALASEAARVAAGATI